MNACPECKGPRHEGHPGGALVSSHAPSCQLGRAQDATQHADVERTLLRPEITRPATEAEAVLLTSLAIAVPAEVSVTRLTRSVVRRHYGEG